MRRQRFCLAFAAVLVACWPARGLAAPLRGIELHPDAPESVVKAFAQSGLNTVVIPFRRQGDLSEPAFVKSLARWGKLAKRYKLRCLVAVRLFGPPDYAGAKGGYTRCVEAVATGGPCVSPGDRKYWTQHVTPRVRRIAELAKQNGLAGALFDYQATLTAVEYNASYCFSNVCWHAFVNAKHEGDKKLLGLKPRARVNWVRTSPSGGAYYAFLSGIIQEEMAKAFQAARAAFPEVIVGVYGFWDTWFYRGIVRATSQADDLPPAVMAEYERSSLGRLCPLLKPTWARARLKFAPVARLSLDYYLPADVQNQIAELDGDRTGFLLRATDALWRRVTDVYHVYPPMGSARAYADAVRKGLKGQRTGQRLLFNKPHYSLYMPRVGLVEGVGLSGLLGGMIKRLAESFQLPTVQLSTARPEQWKDMLSVCNVILVLPGAVTANAEGMAAAAPAFARFLHNGGVLIVLNASDRKAIGWLADHASRFACEAERRSGMKQGWLANEGSGLLASPVYIEKLAPTGVRFKSFAPQYSVLAKDDQDGAYLLSQPVGRGLLVVSAGPVMPVELLANAFFRQLRRGDVFTTTLLPGADKVRFGTNELMLGVAEVPEPASNVNVFVDVIDTHGKQATHQRFNVSVAGDGLRIPLRYDVNEEGVGRIVVTIADPTDGGVLRRRHIRLLHEHRVDVLPDKNYYTTESHAVLRLRYLDASLRKASVRVKLVGSGSQPELTGQEIRLAKIPIAQTPPGEHELEVSFVQDGKVVYARTLTLRKEPPFPTAVKLLHHRSCVLEVDGKPFFPFGCYGGQDAGLEALGVNATVGGPDKAGKLRFAPHGLKGWALDDKMTPQKVRDELRGEKYKMLLSWYMFDEPALNSQSPDHVRRYYEHGRRKDPYHPQMLVYVGSASYPQYPDYMPVAECQMMDHYPLPFFAPSTYGRYLREVTEAARGRRNVWGVPQCFDWREIGAAIGPFKREDLHPRGPEALNYVYQSVIEGAGAITFWTFRYAAGDASRYGPFRKALAEGAKLTQLVAKGVVVDSPCVRPLGAQVRCRTFQVGKEIYVVAANYLGRKATVTFSAPYLKGRTLRQYLPSDRQLGGLTDTFGPLAGKVYVVPAP